MLTVSRETYKEQRPRRNRDSQVDPTFAHFLDLIDEVIRANTENSRPLQEITFPDADYTERTRDERMIRRINSLLNHMKTRGIGIYYMDRISGMKEKISGVMSSAAHSRSASLNALSTHSPSSSIGPKTAPEAEADADTDMDPDPAGMIDSAEDSSSLTDVQETIEARSPSVLPQHPSLSVSSSGATDGVDDWLAAADAQAEETLAAIKDNLAALDIILLEASMRRPCNVQKLQAYISVIEDLQADDHTFKQAEKHILSRGKTMVEDARFRVKAQECLDDAVAQSGLRLDEIEDEDRRGTRHEIEIGDRQAKSLHSVLTELIKRCTEARRFRFQEPDAA